MKAARFSSEQRTVFPILFAISFSHLLNDTIQSLIPAMYPLLKASFNLNFAQIGLITLCFQLAASLLQPLIGLYTDRNPQPYSLSAGMTFSLAGLICLAFVSNYYFVLFSVCLIGVGSSVFHPEASRLAYLASGGKRGLAQSIFQLGGNAGSSLGPLLAALIIVPFGRVSVSWFSLLALMAIFVLIKVGSWYKVHLVNRPKQEAAKIVRHGTSKSRILISVVILMLLIFSKYFYMASMTSYFTFFLIDKFHLNIQSAQLYLFTFLLSIACGTLIGGPLGDRFGRKYVIWVSILGVAPFSLLLPYASLFWTGILVVFIGLILASAFSAILVYAQELIPGKLGLISGLFFGFAFGMGGIGSAVLGWLADHNGIRYVFEVCAFLPLIGLLTGWLPDIEMKNHKPER